jgi:glucose-1-phosphate cytidylyltransferase
MMMDAVILCGGLGTRLREETEFKPKPMVTIGTKPILWHIMSHYRTFGVRNFVLCLGYKGEIIRDFFLNYRNYSSDVELDLSTGAVSVYGKEKIDWRVTLVDTGQAANTGARVRKAAKYVKQPRFFATYGDGVADVDIAQLLSFHTQSGKKATVTAVRPPSRFGELVLDDNRIHAFVEKPQVGQGWINGGFFTFETAAVKEFPEDDDLSLEKDVLESLAAHGHLGVFKHSGFWQCMDTFREMQLLNELWAHGKAPWKTW